MVATISANVSNIDFIMRGLPGQPESECNGGERVVKVEVGGAKLRGVHAKRAKIFTCHAHF